MVPSPPAPAAPRSSRRRSIVALLVLVVLAAVACDPRPYSGSQPQSPKVAVVGDSLTDAVWEATTHHLVADGWNASVTGIATFSIRDQFDMLEKVAATRPQVAVVALGTNDLHDIDRGTQTWDGMRADARHALHLLRDVPCVVWVGVNESSGWYPHGLRHDTAGWVANWWLAAELSDARPSPGTSVWADWADAARPHPHLFRGAHDVHLSPAGEVAYRTLLVDSVRRCPGNPVVGHVDAVTAEPGQVTIAGWAVDPDVASTDVHVYVDGIGAVAVRADAERPDVAAAVPHASGANGFHVAVAAGPGSRQVCVYAIDQGPGGGNPLLGCRSAAVPEP